MCLLDVHSRLMSLLTSISASPPKQHSQYMCSTPALLVVLHHLAVLDRRKDGAGRKKGVKFAVHEEHLKACMLRVTDIEVGMEALEWHRVNDLVALKLVKKVCVLSRSHRLSLTLLCQGTQEEWCHRNHVPPHPGRPPSSRPDVAVLLTSSQRETAVECMPQFSACCLAC